MPQITIDLDKCTGEGTCLKVCPISNFEIKELSNYEVKKSVILDQDICLMCKTCEFICPVHAIKVIE